MVRFVNGVPSVVSYSEHSGGSAYTYAAVQKIGVRPVSYTAIGTHANYAVRFHLLISSPFMSSHKCWCQTSGDHDYDVPFGLLKDQTNQGPLWDVTQNFRGFWFTPSTGQVSIAPGAGIGGNLEVSEGASWLNFAGAWGDQQWPTTKRGQYCIVDECYIVSGPTGKYPTCPGASHENYPSPVNPIGPLSKNLGRTAPCQDESSCTVQTSL